MRTIVRHVRHNPIPSGLLAASIVWLLFEKAVETEEAEEFTGDWDEEEDPGHGLAERFEKELVDHVSDGYDQSRKRLGEVAQRYPWAVAATVVGASILAGLFLPGRRGPSGAGEGEDRPS